MRSSRASRFPDTAALVFCPCAARLWGFSAADASDQLGRASGHGASLVLGGPPAPSSASQDLAAKVDGLGVAPAWTTFAVPFCGRLSK